MTNTKDYITIRGARENNLANVTVQIPKNKLVVLSGVSGSGKSSIAMETLYAEGQRRYVESLSAYARQFLGMMKRPEVDTIDGLSPAIAIDQHSLSHNPRSTVGTVTEIYDYFRVLFARVGLPHCPECGREVSRQTEVGIANKMLARIEQILAKQAQARLMVLAPVIRDKKGEFGKLFFNLKKKGFSQARVDGYVFSLNDDLFLIKPNRHNIEAVIDRIVVTKKDYSADKLRQRLVDDVQIGLDLANDLVILGEVKDKGFAMPEKPKDFADLLFSRRFACPDCDISLPPLEPRLFSFNSPQGACKKCNGIGAQLKIDESRVSPWKAQMMEKQYYSTTSDVIRQEIEKYMIKEICPVCRGRRLKQVSLAVTVDNKSIAQMTELSLEELRDWIKKLPGKLGTDAEAQVAGSLVAEIGGRLEFLVSVGVDYLTLSRSSSTLSVGEAQRIRLASQIGTGLTGVLYILDEPTVGLHQRDTQKLIKTLKKLRDLGNTVVVVEHDEEVLEAADWIVDFGPLAGKLGGKVVAEGTPAEIKKKRSSLTGQYLSGHKKVERREPRHLDQKHRILLRGCQEHNLKRIDVNIPLGGLVCLTGVSGSGKSTLIHDTLYPAIKQALDPYFKQKPGVFTEIAGVEALENVLLIDQSPIGRTSRSNPATYSGVFTDIRQFLAQTKEARLKGLDSTYFSFNTKGGRCEACAGQGMNRIQMQFLPDVWVTCEECGGKRFQAPVLEVEYKEKNIHDILNLTIGEALEFFSSFHKITHKLEVLKKIGLDYLELGQPSPTLSGGESQRLKVARELVKPSRKDHLYLLDEPTTGLHADDVRKLLAVLEELIAKGNSVVVIEHNLDIIKNADWVIDLGPEGGEKGGQVVAEGPPNVVAVNEGSWTGEFLEKHVFGK